MKLGKGIATWIWVALILGVVALWLAEPERFSQAGMQALMERWGAWAFAGFVVASFLRGPLLIPSTPVVLAGGALFPDRPWVVILVSMAGIVFSAAFLYRFPGYAGYDVKLAARYPAQLARLQEHLQKPRAVAFVTLWAFFPAVPTDLICYAAGLVRMPMSRLLTGIIAGELPLVTFYVLAGRQVADLLTS